MILAAALFWTLTTLQTPPPDTCSYDEEAMLALNQNDFDQNLKGGWRILSYKGCEEEAADLIQKWRKHHKSAAYILFWHEGQLRAQIGQTETAISLFEKSRKPTEDDHGFGWNYYVEGSIGFLTGDKTKLLNARENLLSLTKPQKLNLVDSEGNPTNIKWPMNLHVLDDLLECWGRSYKEAYAGCQSE